MTTQHVPAAPVEPTVAECAALGIATGVFNLVLLFGLVVAAVALSGTFQLPFDTVLGMLGMASIFLMLIVSSKL